MGFSQLSILFPKKTFKDFGIDGLYSPITEYPCADEIATAFITDKIV